LTTEEKKAIEDKLVKITTINQTLLKKRAQHEYDRSSLEQTEKLSFLSPDFTTLWNYRREILSHIFEHELHNDYTAQYAMIVKELEFLVKGIMRSPKSYTLWFHR
jgi:geranylgeranyl transferase type-2 subunit alpha